MLVINIIWSCIVVSLVFGCSIEMQPAEVQQPAMEMEKTDKTVGDDNAKGVPGAPTPAPGVPAPAPAPGVPAPAPAPLSDKRDEQTRRLAVESMCTCTVVDEDDFEYGSEQKDYRIYCELLGDSFALWGLAGASNFRCYCPNTSYYLDEVDTKGRAECLAGTRNLSTVWDCSERTKKVDPAVLGEEHSTTECSWSGKPYYSCNCSVTPRVWNAFSR